LPLSKPLPINVAKLIHSPFLIRIGVLQIEPHHCCNKVIYAQTWPCRLGSSAVLHLEKTWDKPYIYQALSPDAGNTPAPLRVFQVNSNPLEDDFNSIGSGGQSGKPEQLAKKERVIWY